MPRQCCGPRPVAVKAAIATSSSSTDGWPSVRATNGLSASNALHCGRRVAAPAGARCTTAHSTTRPVFGSRHQRADAIRYAKYAVHQLGSRGDSGGRQELGDFVVLCAATRRDPADGDRRNGRCQIPRPRLIPSTVLVGCDGGALDRVRNARRHIGADAEKPLRIGEVLRGIGQAPKRLPEAVPDRLRVRRDLARLGRFGELAVDIVAGRPVENLALSAIERLVLRLSRERRQPGPSPAHALRHRRLGAPPSSSPRPVVRRATCVPSGARRSGGRFPRRDRDT